MEEDGDVAWGIYECHNGISSTSQCIGGANAQNDEGLAQSQTRIRPNWCDMLPVVLLGMRAAVKQDINCSVAEMVYGEQLRLPSEFFTISAGNWNTDPSFVVDLRQRMQQVRPVPPVWHGEESRRSFVHTDLPTAIHTCLCVLMHTSLRFKLHTKDRSRY